MNHGEENQDDLDFTSPKDMTLSFMSKMRDLIADAIENHLDEYEIVDWGFYDKSKCYKMIEEILADNGAHEKHAELLMKEAEVMFNTEKEFRLDIITMVENDKDDSHLY